MNEGIPQFEEQRKRFSAEITRLQQRQRELVQQTVLMLEEEASSVRTPLEKEIKELNKTINGLGEENQKLLKKIEELQQAGAKHIQELEEQFSGFFKSSHEHFEELQHTLHKEVVAPVAKEIKVVEAKLAKQPVASYFKFPKIKREANPEPIKIVREAPAKPQHHRKHAARRVAGLALTALLAYFGARELPKYAMGHKLETGQVAGVSTTRTDSTVGPDGQPVVEKKYNEAQADVAFQDTTWKEFDSVDYGLSLEYPANASDLVQSTGGSDTWILRKTGYLMKFNFDTLTAGETLQQWWTANQDSYADQYTQPTATTFKNLPALVATPLDAGDQNAGRYYFVKRSATVDIIWVKSNINNQDDTDRLQHMLDSLKITN